jgi:hypothetical protein
MRRTVLLVAALLCAAAISSYGQDFTVTAGGKLGANLGWFTGDDWEDAVKDVKGDNSVGVGPAVGAYLDIALTEQFGLQPELWFFNQKGAYTFTVKGDDYRFLVRTNTLQLPFFLKGRFIAGDGAVYALVGPSAFLIVGDVKSTLEEKNAETTKYRAPDNRFLFGVAGGLGYEHPVGAGELLLELRYTRVLSQYDNKDKIYSNAASLLFGYGVQVE